MTAPVKVQLPEHGADAKDSGLFQNVRILPPQPLDFSKTDEVEVDELLRLLLVNHLNLRSIQQRHQDENFVRLDLFVQVEPMTILYGVQQPANNLTGFGDTVCLFILDFLPR
ncbi:unnamed protein product [Schistocephalus solidus]|uniref:Type VI secretion system baseplate subunit TssE n=1 Tax=Schistocephalus solidus TaxID=70667 RepID=A0A183TCL3_SCHSO|nr:unnamed protein product [Schistocephalus solidus]